MPGRLLRQAKFLPGTATGHFLRAWENPLTAGRHSVRSVGGLLSFGMYIGGRFLTLRENLLTARSLRKAEGMFLWP